MTVLQRLHHKHLVVQIRDDRAYQYVAYRGREELVAELMVDALDQATGRGDRLAALMQFVKGWAPRKLTHSVVRWPTAPADRRSWCGEVLQLLS